MVRAAIRACDQWCEQRYSVVFAQIPVAARDALLGGLEKGELSLSTVDAKEFFDLLWSLTQEGFFAGPLYGGKRDKVGWRLVGSPGVAAAYNGLIEPHDVPYAVEPVGIQDIEQGRVGVDQHGHPPPPLAARDKAER